MASNDMVEFGLPEVEGQVLVFMLDSTQILAGRANYLKYEEELLYSACSLGKALNSDDAKDVTIMEYAIGTVYVNLLRLLYVRYPNTENKVSDVVQYDHTLPVTLDDITARLFLGINTLIGAYRTNTHTAFYSGTEYIYHVLKWVATRHKTTLTKAVASTLQIMNGGEPVLGVLDLKAADKKFRLHSNVADTASEAPVRVDTPMLKVLTEPIISSKPTPRTPPRPSSLRIVK